MIHQVHLICLFPKIHLLHLIRLSHLIHLYIHLYMYNPQESQKISGEIT